MSIEYILMQNKTPEFDVQEPEMVRYTYILMNSSQNHGSIDIFYKGLERK